MPYQDHFRLADDLITHLDTVFVGLRDPFLESRYTGFLAVSSVTVLELSMKTIFVDFAEHKHKILGNFCASSFERTNGRITTSEISGKYVLRFGVKYQTRFKKALVALEKQSLRTTGISVLTAYGNLITWRHGFAHDGVLPAHASYGEVKHAYQCGKAIMDCLYNCMKR